MAHQWVIRKSASGEYRAYYEYNGEKIWWTEGYSSKQAAQNAILSAKRNAPGAPVEDITDEPADELQPFREAGAPSSDLILTPDHKSVEYREFEKALNKFADHLRTSNDLQNLDASELEIARKELALIREAGASRSFRAEALWNMTKTTSVWIAEKAADGVVKALAVGLLAAAAHLLGVPLF